MKVANITFPDYSGIRCLMMPYIQGDPMSVPEQYRKGYEDILSSVFIKKGDIGYLTIDESTVTAGNPHRGDRAKFGRALHTEAGVDPNKIYCWGGAGWGRTHKVELERDVQVLLANSIDASCALWNAEHENTSLDGDIGDYANQYPYSDAIMMGAGEVHQIGILTPHESLPIKQSGKRQFLRIISSGVHGREPHFTTNNLLTKR